MCLMCTKTGITSLTKPKPLNFLHIITRTALLTFCLTHPTKSRIYPLSIPETKVIDDYVEENLKLGFIRPSTSKPPLDSFLWKKRMAAYVLAWTTEA